jgi:predicted acyl esterase
MRSLATPLATRTAPSRAHLAVVGVISLSALLSSACGERAEGAASAPVSDAGASPSDAGATGPCAVHAFSDVAIPLRDGKSLAAFVRAPVDPACKLPVVVIQTPYGKDGAKALWFAASTRQPLFESKDYAFVVVDTRGFFGSQGAAKLPLTPAEDGFDVVEWAAEQPWSTGAVGTWGASALGVQQYATASARPPHLRAIVPIFCQANSTYTLYYPGGVLRREYADFLTRYFGSSGTVLQYPYDGPAWTYAASLVPVRAIAAPALVVVGTYDLNPIGSLDVFAQLVAGPAGADARLLVGPWIHQATGGDRALGRPLTDEERRYADGDRVIQRDSLAFFDRHLRGRAESPASAWAPVRVIGGGADGREEGLAAWPPASRPTTLFLTPSGALDPASPTRGERIFPYDPNDPSPTIGGGTLLGTLHHGPTSQAPVLARADAIAFASAPLAEPLKVGGRVAITLAVATTGVDTDLAVRLTDVDANGDHVLVAEGIRRLKLVANATRPTLVPAGQRVEVPVQPLTDLAYTFAAGHRVGLVVSNANYPRFDRNPNTGDDFLADGGAPARAITTTLFTDGASRVVLPVR